MTYEEKTAYNKELMTIANSALQSHDLGTLEVLLDTVAYDINVKVINIMSIESMIKTLEA